MIVHIGGSRCASTYLQKRVLNNVIGYSFYGRGDKTTEELESYCIGDKDNYTHKPRNKSIISHEGLSVLKNKENGYISDRLRRSLGKVRILYIIRNQNDWLNSRYSHDIENYMGTHTSYYSFHEWIRGDFHNELSQVFGESSLLYKPLPKIKYDKIIKSYKSIFDTVVVLPMEHLYDNSLIYRIETELGIDINKDKSKKENKRRDYCTEEMEKLLSFMPWNKKLANFLGYIFRCKHNRNLPKHIKHVISKVNSNLKSMEVNLTSHYTLDQ